MHNTGQPLTIILSLPLIQEGQLSVSGERMCTSTGQPFTIILSLPLIQEGQLSVSGERMCTSTGQPRRGMSAQEKMWLGNLTGLT